MHQNAECSRETVRRTLSWWQMVHMSNAGISRLVVSSMSLFLICCIPSFAVSSDILARLISVGDNDSLFTRQYKEQVVPPSAQQGYEPSIFASAPQPPVDVSPTRRDFLAKMLTLMVWPAACSVQVADRNHKTIYRGLQFKERPGGGGASSPVAQRCCAGVPVP